jgi:chromosome segregation ATPase
MSLVSARPELVVSVVGEDQTAQMLAEAQKRIAAYEAEMKKLAATAKVVQGETKQSTSALQEKNKQFADMGKQAKDLLDGFDKFGKGIQANIGTIGMFAGAISGAIAGAVEFGKAIGDLVVNSFQVSNEFRAATLAAQQWADTLRDVGDAGRAAQRGTLALETSVIAVQQRLARARGDATLAQELEAQMELAKLAEERRDAADKYVEAQRELRTRQAQYQQSVQALAELDNQLTEMRAAALAVEIIGGKAANEKAQLALQGAELDRAILAERIKQTAEAIQAQSGNVKGLRAIMDELEALEGATRERTPEATPTPTPTPTRARAGGGRPRPTGPSAEARANLEIELIRRELHWMQQELELESDIAEEEQKRIDLLQKRIDLQKSEEEQIRKRIEREEREDLAAPYLGLSRALSEHLGPALSEVEHAMRRVNDLFSSFVEGQIDFEAALAGSTHAIGRMVAEQLGGVRAMAAVDAAYHIYKGFGTAFTNPAESAGHFIAAAGLTAVAAGAIPSGTAGAQPKPRGIEQRREEERSAPSEGRGITYNFQAGIIDGQSVAASIRRAERASTGTGYTREGV